MKIEKFGVFSQFREIPQNLVHVLLTEVKYVSINNKKRAVDWDFGHLLILSRGNFSCLLASCTD